MYGVGGGYAFRAMLISDVSAVLAAVAQEALNRPFILRCLRHTTLSGNGGWEKDQTSHMVLHFSRSIHRPEREEPEIQKTKR